MEFLANPDLKNVAQGATPTGSTKVAVLEGANNTIKYRSVDDIVSAGGGTTAPRDYLVTIFGAEGTGTAQAVSIAYNKSNYGWPYDGNGDEADSKLRGCKFLIPFKPANYRISAVCVTAPSYDAGPTPPTGGDFGIKFQRATTNSTNDNDWTDIVTLNFKGRAIGDIANVNGTISISGTDTLFYIRTIQINNLSNPQTTASISLRSFVANFWS